MDHADYVLMRAPRPTLMCAATGDYFDIRGTWDSFRQAKRFYSRLGFAERADLAETDARHGFSKQLRVAAVRWMRRWLLGIDDAITEPPSKIATDHQARCTPRGQVMLLEGARTTYDLNTDLEKKLAKARGDFWQRTDRAAARAEVRRIAGIRRLADLPKPKSRKAGTTKEKTCRIDKLILEPESGIWLPALAFVPAKRSGQAYLYLHAEGKQADAAPDGPIRELAGQGHLVLAVDLRGLGETAGARPGKRGISHYVGGDWKELYLAYLLGRSYLAMRAQDILVCARFLASLEAGERANRVHLVSIGKVGPAALHAAALEPRLFATVTLKRCLVSWSNVVHTPMAAGQFENVVHAALKTYDLPDLLRTLPKDKVTWSEPLDALGKPAAKEGG